jgi:hypothetical protein
MAMALLLVPSGASPQGLESPAQDPSASPENRGRDIALEADRRGSGYGDLRARLTMVLRNRHGDERTRQMRIRVLEGTAGGDRTLLVFDRPRDLSGTALLTHANPDGGDDQWLYLPALKRVKRIAASGQSGSFMGSEFAYEDIGSQEVEKYRYRFHGEDTLDGEHSLVVERVPLDGGSGYSRQLVWFDSEAYRVLQIEYYDRRGDRLKTLRLHGYRLYVECLWRPDVMEMVNHQTGKSTTLTWEEYEFDTGLRERDFERGALGRVR